MMAEGYPNMKQWIDLPARSAAGVVYVAGGHVGDEFMVKIGWTTGNAQKRVASMQTGCPILIDLFKTIPVKGQGAEVFLHEHWSHLRQHGEWFACDDVMRAWVFDNSADFVGVNS
mgnify:CR=1 FL=1